MDQPNRRYMGFGFPDGVVVLDQITGELVMVPVDGAPHRQLRAPAVQHVASPVLSTLVAPPARQGAASLAPTALDHEVLATFPYPIAIVYKRFFEETDPRQKCRLLVDTFTTVLKTWALALASEYLHSENLRDAALNELLGRDFQRPLISVWHLFISRALGLMRKQKHGMFMPELAAAYDTLETRCRTPFLARTRYEDASGEARTRESKLGKIQALIKYRNGLAHGYNAPAARATEHLVTYLPLLRDVLAESRFMTRYPLYASAEGPGDAYRLMGSEPPVIAEHLDALGSAPPRVFVASPSGAILSLDALLELDVPGEIENAIRGVERELYLFEGNTKSALIYASPLGDSVEKQATAASWRSLLSGKAIDVQLLRRDGITLEALREHADVVTRATLSALSSAGKYLPEVAFRQPAIAEVLSQFELGDYRGLVVGGESGSGKSTLLASWAEERAAAGDVVLFYRAASLLDADLQARIVHDLRLREPYFEDFLVTADALFSQTDRRLRIVVDALNEHPGDLSALVGAVDALVLQASSHPWLRVLVSIRATSHARLPKHARLGRLDGTKYVTFDERKGERTPLLTLPPLTNDEVGVLYQRYREYRRREPDDPADAGVYCFRPKTEFPDLVLGGHSTLTMMRSPLMLRLLGAAFHGKELPAELSYDEAMRIYFEQVVLGKGDTEGPRWDRGALLKTIVAELDLVRSETIERDKLYEVPALRRALQNAQKDSPYAQLLDLGVLTESWDGDTCFIRFAFDRLFEFMLAELHEPAVTSELGLLDMIRRTSSFGALRGALVVIVTRKCAKGDLGAWARALELCDELLPDAPERGAMIHVGTGVFEQLSRSGQDVGPAIAAVLSRSNETAMRILLDAFDSLFASGDTASAEAVARGALERASASGRAGIETRALFALATVLQNRASLDEALDLYERVSRSAGGEDAALAHRADVRRSDILRGRGKLEEATRLLDHAARALQEMGALADASEARRLQAILARDAGRFDEARLLSEEALELARVAGDAHAETQASISCGYVAWRRGDLAKATEWFERALPLADATGNARSIASVAGSLAVLARERGDCARAISYAERQLALSLRSDMRRSVAIAHQNLGVFRFETGDIDGARKSLERAYTLLRDIDVGFPAMSLVNLAHLDRHEGRNASARARLEEARELAQGKNPDAAGDALWMLASLALEDDDIERAEALAHVLEAESAGAPKRLSQLAALRAQIDLRHAEPRPDPARSASILAGFASASPRPEVHELPIDGLCELALRADSRQAAELASAALALLAGRPHRNAATLATLAAPGELRSTA